MVGPAGGACGPERGGGSWGPSATNAISAVPPDVGSTRCPQWTWYVWGCRGCHGLCVTLRSQERGGDVLSSEEKEEEKVQRNQVKFSQRNPPGTFLAKAQQAKKSSQKCKEVQRKLAQVRKTKCMRSVSLGRPARGLTSPLWGDRSPPETKATIQPHCFTSGTLSLSKFIDTSKLQNFSYVNYPSRGLSRRSLKTLHQTSSFKGLPWVPYKVCKGLPHRLNQGHKLVCHSCKMSYISAKGYAVGNRICGSKSQY